MQSPTREGTPACDPAAATPSTLRFCNCAVCPSIGSAGLPSLEPSPCSRMIDAWVTIELLLAIFRDINTVDAGEDILQFPCDPIRFGAVFSLEERE